MNTKWHRIKVTDKGTIGRLYLYKGKSRVTVFLWIFFSTWDGSKLIRKTSEDFTRSWSDWRCHLWTENNGNLSHRCSLEQQTGGNGLQTHLNTATRSQWTTVLGSAVRKCQKVVEWLCNVLAAVGIQLFDSLETEGANRLRYKRPGKTQDKLSYYRVSTITFLSCV